MIYFLLFVVAIFAGYLLSKYLYGSCPTPEPKDAYIVNDSSDEYTNLDAKNSKSYITWTNFIGISEADKAANAFYQYPPRAEEKPDEQVERLKNEVQGEILGLMAQLGDEASSNQKKPKAKRKAAGKKTKKVIKKEAAKKPSKK